jgi:hypothetical protein
MANPMAYPRGYFFQYESGALGVGASGGDISGKDERLGPDLRRTGRMALH